MTISGPGSGDGMEVGPPARVLIADDQALLRAGMRAMLAGETDIEVVGEAADGLEAVELCRELGPDLVLMTRTWTVDTAKPTVESWSPKGRKVKPTAKPTITFSDKMNEGSVEASASGKPTTFVLKKGRTVIPATVAYTEDGDTFKAVLTPNKKLRRGTKYTATVASAATDPAGNALVAKSWAFTVRR